MLRRLLLVFALPILGCPSSSHAPTAVPAGPHAPQSEGVAELPPDAPGAPTEPKTEAVWSNLVATHGAGLAGVTRADAKSIQYNQTARELVVMFDWPMTTDDQNMMRPSRGIDYAKIQTQLGATKVGGVPREFQMMCGTNHGGDFEVDGAKFGIYVSGGCHHVRIFDATPDAVRLLLGEDFVSALTGCEARLLKACRTSDELRVQFDRDVPLAFASLEKAGGTKLERLKDGWLAGKPSDYAADKEFATVTFNGKDIACTSNLPEYSPPEACELNGTTHRPNDPCRGSGMCKEDGRCATVDKDCAATAQRHCEKSRGCFQEGRCALSNGACVATEESCDNWRMCELQARCSLAGDRCLPRGDDCREHKWCKTSGDCAVVNDKCGPATDEDCKQSERCKTDGYCKLQRGRCSK